MVVEEFGGVEDEALRPGDLYLIILEFYLLEAEVELLLEDGLNVLLLFDPVVLQRLFDLRILDGDLLYFLEDLILVLPGCLEILQQFVSDLVVAVLGLLDAADVDGVLLQDVLFQARHLALDQFLLLEDEPVEDLPV